MLLVSLGSSLLPSPGSARINTLGIICIAVVRVAVKVGETIGMSTRHRASRAACHGTLARPRTSKMNLVSTVLLALAMSTDAFAAAVGKGATLHKPQIREAIRTGIIFGSIEAITPVIGWSLGIAAVKYVVAWDHWIAFTLLALLGLRMIFAGFRQSDPVERRPRSHPFWALATTGFATSIDAMAVGVGLAFLNVNIIATAAAIGLATFTMVTLGVMVGRVLGVVVGKRAEIVGGFLLIGIGSYILFEHLTSVT
jgi:manganese efflux pump family protein